jgi:hypothetical protein
MLPDQLRPDRANDSPCSQVSGAISASSRVSTTARISWGTDLAPRRLVAVDVPTHTVDIESINGRNCPDEVGQQRTTPPMSRSAPIGRCWTARAPASASDFESAVTPRPHCNLTKSGAIVRCASPRTDSLACSAIPPIIPIERRRLQRSHHVVIGVRALSAADAIGPLRG